MKVWRDQKEIKTDRPVTVEEQELLDSLMEWADIAQEGTLNESRWNDYVRNINGPRIAALKEEGEGEVVYDEKGHWSLDWWECLFEDWE